MSREEFNLWAYRWLENFDNILQLSSTEDEIHKNIIFLLAIDLEIESNIYIHTDEEIAEWMNIGSPKRK